MSFLGIVGAAVGGFFGGPAGAALGATLGGGIDSQNAISSASKTQAAAADNAAQLSYRTAQEQMDLQRGNIANITSLAKGLQGDNLYAAQQQYVQNVNSANAALNEQRGIQTAANMQQLNAVEQNRLQNWQAYRQAANTAAGLQEGALRSVTNNLGQVASENIGALTNTANQNTLLQKNLLDTATGLQTGATTQNNAAIAANAAQNIGLQQNIAGSNTALQQQALLSNAALQGGWYDNGQQALARLNAGLQQGGEFTKAFDFSTLDPSYQWRLQQGQKAMEASAAARGIQFSGGNLASLNNYAQNAASQEYQNAFNRYQTQQNAAYDKVLQASNQGLSVGQNLGTAASNYATNVGAINTGYGANVGQFSTNATNAIAQNTANLATNLTGYQQGYATNVGNINQNFASMTNEQRAALASGLNTAQTSYAANAANIAASAAQNEANTNTAYANAASQLYGNYANNMNQLQQSNLAANIAAQNTLGTATQQTNQNVVSLIGNAQSSGTNNISNIATNAANAVNNLNLSGANAIAGGQIAGQNAMNNMIAGGLTAYGNYLTQQQNQQQAINTYVPTTNYSSGANYSLSGALPNVGGTSYSLTGR